MVLLKKIMRYVYRKLLFIYFQIKRYLFQKKYPDNEGGKVYVHLGCGEIDSPEFINVDSRYFPHIHHVGDVAELIFFKDNFADLIYACHVLEHVPMENLSKVLQEWYRVLKPGGTLRISVPDFDYILNIYKDNDNCIDFIWRPLFGGQEYNENAHYAVFNSKYLEKILLQAGFKQTRIWDPNKVEHHDFEDWASVEYKVNEKVYPISLNMEAVK